jgi:hypothetical protein
MSASAEPSTPQPVWSSETRTWVSLVLFAHLFAVVVAVTSYTRPSLLQQRLHDLFVPYLRNLHLTALPNSYPYARFHLTHGGSSDVDYQVEVDVERADGSAATASIPSGPLQPLIRLRRYQALANAAGTLAAGEFAEEYTSILAKAIAASVLKQENATGGTIRIRALGLPTEADMTGLSGVARAARENVSDVYEAQVLVGPLGVELLRRSTTLEIAPIEGARTPTTPPASAPATAPGSNARPSASGGQP